MQTQPFMPCCLDAASMQPSLKPPVHVFLVFSSKGSMCVRVCFVCQEVLSLAAHVYLRYHRNAAAQRAPSRRGSARPGIEPPDPPQSKCV